jgi:hypothetical protein
MQQRWPLSSEILCGAVLLSPGSRASAACYADSWGLCCDIGGSAQIVVRSILNGWVGTKLDELPPQSKKYLDGYHRKMNPHHEAMVRLDYHGAQ